MIEDPEGAPLSILGQHVLPEWIDLNGHMNVAYYVLAFDRALDDACGVLGIDWNYTKRVEAGIFVLEAHVTYQREVMNGDPLRFTFQLLDWDDKRMHYFLAMYHADQNFMAATSEQVALHMDLKLRRSSPFPVETQDRLTEMAARHRSLPRPPQVGRTIGLRRKASGIA
jgi:acyl-CoA thioester hydrolase